MTGSGRGHGGRVTTLQGLKNMATVLTGKVSGLLAVPLLQMYVYLSRYCPRRCKKWLET